MQFQGRSRKIIIRKSENILQRLPVENALISQIMNSQHGFHRFIEREVAVVRLEQDRNHGTLPIMTMNDVRLKVQMGQCLNHSPAKKPETLRIISVSVKPT